MVAKVTLRPMRLLERPAAVAGMGSSSFHQHFRTLTSLSPVQHTEAVRSQTQATVLKNPIPQGLGMALL
jgi:methylphosphotriester-DNA--protein-cysteine methyltransferase